MTEIARIISLFHARPEAAAVLVTLTHVEGSSYRRPGARMVWFEDGTRTGGISGGCLEDDVVAHAQQVFASRAPKVISYDTTDENDLVWGTGTGCDGRVTLLLEYIPVARPAWLTALAANYRAHRPTGLNVVYEGAKPGTALVSSESTGEALRETVAPPQQLLVFGAGDDAQPLVEMAATLGWSVTVVDSRAAYATPARFPQAHAVICAPPEAALRTTGLDGNVPMVIMSHRYRDDRALLTKALVSAKFYVGLLGPRKRTDRLLAEIGANGFEFTDEMKRRLHAPVGLDLGADTPAGVALSILAEVQARLAQAQPMSLRDRPGPIHKPEPSPAA